MGLNSLLLLLVWFGLVWGEGGGGFNTKLLRGDPGTTVRLSWYLASEPQFTNNRLTKLHIIQIHHVKLFWFIQRSLRENLPLISTGHQGRLQV